MDETGGDEDEVGATEEEISAAVDEEDEGVDAGTRYIVANSILPQGIDNPLAALSWGRLTGRGSDGRRDARYR